jgi:hypothetical protein
MTTTVSAIFDSYADASSAVARLKEAGFADRDISIISNDRAVDRTAYGDYRHDETVDATADGVATGAGIGAAAGGAAGLLAGLGLLAIPGLGPIVAAGWLASTLVGAGAGVAAGGIVGALAGAGVSDDDAHAYAEGVRRGGSIVSARVAEADADRARAALEPGSYDLRERAQDWRSKGWSGRYHIGE